MPYIDITQYQISKDNELIHFEGIADKDDPFRPWEKDQIRGVVSTKFFDSHYKADKRFYESYDDNFYRPPPGRIGVFVVNWIELVHEHSRLLNDLLGEQS